MKTIDEVIQEYMKDIGNPDSFDVNVGGTMVKQIIRLYGIEVVNECQNVMWDNQRADINILDELKERLI